MFETQAEKHLSTLQDSSDNDNEKNGGLVNSKNTLPRDAHGATFPELNDTAKLNTQTILAALALIAQFNAYILTLLIPSTTLSYINADLGPDPNYTWITVSWTLGASIVVSVGGRLADIFGRRYFMMTGSFLGIVGCLVGATGQSINQMIASGTIFGLASGFQELGYACLQEILPNKYRMVGVGKFSTSESRTWLMANTGVFEASVAAAFISPIISYAFIAHTSIGWRGAYWYMFAFHCAAGIVLVLFYHPPNFYLKHRHDGKTKRQLIAELDFVGIFLFTAASTLFLVGVNFGGRQYKWSSAVTIAPMVVGLVLYIVLGFYETRSSLRYPLFPPRLFKQVRGFTMVLVVCFVGGMLYYSMNVLWPRQSQILFVPATQPILRGVYATIFSFGSLLGGFIMIFVCSRLNHERSQLVVFMVLQTALIGSLASVGVHDKAQAIVTIVLGAACVTPPQLISFTMLSLTLEDQTDIGIAVGLAGTFRLLGGAIATAIYSAILAARFSSSLPAYVEQVISTTGFPVAETKELIAATSLDTATAYDKVPSITKAVIVACEEAYKLAYVQAFKLVYLTAIAFGGAAIVAAALTKSTDVRLKNNARAVRLMNEASIDGQALPSAPVIAEMKDDQP